MKLKFLVYTMLTALFSVTSASAQEASSPIITADNIHQLQSVLRIDFAGAPANAGKIENGWFVVSPSGNLLASMNRANEMVVWKIIDGSVLDTYAIMGEDALSNPILDAAFSGDGSMLASVHAEGGAYDVVYRYPDAHYMEYFQFRTADAPLRVWVNGNVWLEVSPLDYQTSRYVMKLSPIPLNRIRTNEILGESEMEVLPSGPENDTSSFLRIGRIDPPLAITVTHDALLKRWNLETGEVTATAQLDSLPGAGQVDADGSHFAWVDQGFQTLHLLDFEAAQDQVTASLGGTYILCLLLSSPADVIIGVDVDQKSNVVAWNVATGEKIDLGKYRPCRRQPDMVRLSKDGTTLVIGCDTGLDIWRVSDSDNGSS